MEQFLDLDEARRKARGVIEAEERVQHLAISVDLMRPEIATLQVARLFQRGLGAVGVLPATIA
jgi:hypothetical protein